MKRWIVLVIWAACFAAGCGEKPVKEAKVEAYDRWNMTRAKVLVSLGEKQLKVGELKKARKTATEALQLRDDYTDARILLSKVLIEQGHYSHAISQLEICEKQDPERPSCPYLLGVAQERHGLLDKALESYLRAQQLDPQSYHPVVAAGEAMVLLGQVKRAQEHVDTFLAKTLEDDASLYELAGRIAMMRGEDARAGRHFRSACDMAPENPHYREMLGKSQMAAGSYHEAAETFHRLTKMEEYEPPAWVYSMLGQCHMALNNPNRARTAFSHASRSNSHSPEVWCDLARAELACGENRRAVLSAREALRRDQKHLDASLLLGYSLLRSKETKDAVTELSRAAMQHPRSSMVHCLLGKAHAAAGQIDKAKGCYAEALRLDPENTAARELLKEARKPARTAAAEADSQ
jgi:predicted Zn-dependent protease